MKIAAGLALLLSAALAAGQEVPASTIARAEALRDAALRQTEALDLVRSLTDSVGPRLSGSEAYARAVSWGVATLERLGFANVHAEKATVPHWVRGEETGEIVAPVRQPLVLTALGGSSPTPAGGVEGEVVELRDVSALQSLVKKEPDAVRGKIVFLSQAMERTRDGSGYGKAVVNRFLGASEAGKAGAVGCLIRSIGTASTRLPHTGAMLVDAAAKSAPAAALSVPDAELLHRVLEDSAGKPVRVRFTLGCRTLPDVEQANVVGEIRGSQAPEEVVLLGAHLDSWDLGTGAIDDGAGIAIVTAAAHAIAQLPRRPRRTIRVVFFANEENGSRGARAYRQAHEKEMDRHVAVIEMDLGADRVWGLAHLAGAEGTPELAAIARLLAPLGITDTGEKGDFGADVSGLRQFGVPLIALNQDALRYFDFHHSADDTFDKIVPANLAQNVAATVAAAYVLADSPGTLGRVPEAKRRLEWWEQ